MSNERNDHDGRVAASEINKRCEVLFAVAA